MRFHIPTSALQRRSENPVGKPGRKIRSRRSVLTRCRVLSSRSRSIKPISLLRHSSSCILCGISNSFIQIHIANSCTCFSSASLLRTMRYNAAGAQLPRAPDRTLGNAILFALPFSPKHIGALRVHEFRLGFQLRHKLH